MICGRCGYNNREEARHCANCGSPLFLGKTRDNRRAELIIVILFILMALLTIVVIGVNLYNNYGTKGEQEEIVDISYDDETEDIQIPSNPIEEPSHPAPEFILAHASSVRDTDTEGGEYSVGSVLSSDPLTKWVPKKSDNGGVGEWIEVKSDTLQYVKGIKILNGYHRSEEIWANNNRVKQCSITFSTGEVYEFTLRDTMEMISLDLGKTVETYSLRLTIKSIYNGTQWNDTAITYLGAY